MPSDLFSLKMRASCGGRHISGAEKILPESGVPAHLHSLLERAMHHANGEPDAWVLGEITAGERGVQLC